MPGLTWALSEQVRIKEIEMSAICECCKKHPAKWAKFWAYRCDLSREYWYAICKRCENHDFEYACEVVEKQAIRQQDRLS